MNKVDTLQASGHLRRLRDAGLLEQKGRAAATYYLPTRALLDGNLPHKAGSLPHNAGSLPHKAGSLPHKPPEPDEGMPDDLAARLARLGQRSLPADLEAAVFELCRWREQTADALADRTGRGVKTIRRYLARMVRDGRLQLRYPQQPNHPDQAYRAAGLDEAAP